MKSNNGLKEMDQVVKFPRIAETNYAVCCNVKPRPFFIGSVEIPSLLMDQLGQDHHSIMPSPQAALLNPLSLWIFAAHPQHLQGDQLESSHTNHN